MTYTQAKKQLAKVGASHAEGEALAAMYAQTLELLHGGRPEKYFEYLAANLDNIQRRGETLLADRAKAWDVLMGAL